MSLQTFFLPHQTLSQERQRIFALELAPEDAHHLRVLRMHPGEHIAVVDADHDYFECCIETVDDGVWVSICGRDGEKDASGLRSHELPVVVALFQGMPKGDRFEMAVRQGTEIGVTSFTPVLCARSVSRPDPARGLRKAKRWQSIAKSAAMQAGRRIVPEVSEPISFDDAVIKLAAFDRVIIFWEGCDADASLAKALQGQSQSLNSVAIVIGPEGGLSDEEIAGLLERLPQACVCTLGSTILRTETAAVVGVSLVTYLLGGLGAAPLPDTLSSNTVKSEYV